MKGLLINIEQESLTNEFFRRVLYTDERVQVVVMALKPGEEIGEETHQLDQFIRVEEGSGTAMCDGVEAPISAGFAVVVPAGTTHNIINGPDAAMKLYTLYAPPNHAPGTVHKTKADAEADERDR